MILYIELWLNFEHYLFWFVWSPFFSIMVGKILEACYYVWDNFILNTVGIIEFIFWKTDFGLIFWGKRHPTGTPS